GSLRIIAGTGGIKPLSESDKRDILGRARKILDADRAPQATFTATSVASGPDGGATITGTLTLRGASGEVPLTVVAAGKDRYRATATVVQSAFGITPYSAMLGALKLADAVGVEAEIDLSNDRINDQSSDQTGDR